MDSLLYLTARGLVALLQWLPLHSVAWIGRQGGKLAYLLDVRHRKIALGNLAAAFQEKSPEQIRALARENFVRIGESFACAIKTAALPPEFIPEIVEVRGAEKIQPGLQGAVRSRVFAIGHFGNFELFARCSVFLPGHTFATTYRGLRQPGLERLMQSLRTQSGCLFFERRRDAASLRRAMNSPGIVLGLMADQSAGSQGVRAPFLGRDCSTTPAPAILALRYNCPLQTAICYRTAPGRWRIEVGDEIPVQQNGQARTVQEITAEVNRAFEAAIRRDPANWFWVHNRWKEDKLPSPAESKAAPL